MDFAGMDGEMADAAADTPADVMVCSKLIDRPHLDASFSFSFSR